MGYHVDRLGIPMPFDGDITGIDINFSKDKLLLFSSSESLASVSDADIQQ